MAQLQFPGARREDAPRTDATERAAAQARAAAALRALDGRARGKLLREALKLKDLEAATALAARGACAGTDAEAQQLVMDAFLVMGQNVVVEHGLLEHAFKKGRLGAAGGRAYKVASELSPRGHRRLEIAAEPLRAQAARSGGYVFLPEIDALIAAWAAPFVDAALRCVGDGRPLDVSLLSKMLQSAAPEGHLRRALAAGWRPRASPPANQSAGGFSYWPWENQRAAAADGLARPSDMLHWFAATRGISGFGALLTEAGMPPPAVIGKYAARERPPPRPAAAQTQRVRNETARWWASAAGRDGRFAAAARGGWAAARATGAVARDFACGIDEISAAEAVADPARFVREYVARARPVMIRAGGARSRYRRAWAHDALLATHGESCWQAPEIPYKDQFVDEKGSSKRARTQSLREYAARADMAAGFASLAWRNNESVAPGYIFATSFLRSCGDTASSTRCADEWADSMPPFVRSRRSGAGFRFAALQFFLGAPLSGAPFHWHQPAANMLAWGRKRWALLPPWQAIYSIVPAAKTFHEHLPYLRRVYNATPLECVQEAGEVLFVPQGMVRCVVNVLPTASVEGEVGPDLASPEEEATARK